MQLTPRLLLAAEMCSGSKRIIDVGCDHGYMCIHLAQNGVECAVASDIRPLPLEKAKANIEAFGLEGRISTALCAGLELFGPGDCDSVIICGMGGEMIADILKNAPWTADGEHALVLQPMTNAPRLRRFLGENGYKVEQERLAAEGDRLYCVLKVRGGEGEDDSRQWLFTERMTIDPLFPLFLKRQLEKYRRILRGRQAGGQNTEHAARAVALLEEYIRNAS